MSSSNLVTSCAVRTRTHKVVIFEFPVSVLAFLITGRRRPLLKKPFEMQEDSASSLPISFKICEGTLSSSPFEVSKLDGEEEYSHFPLILLIVRKVRGILGFHR